MPSLSISYVKIIDLNPSGNADVRLKWVLRNDGASEIRGLFRYVISLSWESENVPYPNHDDTKVQVERTPSPARTHFDLTPLCDRLAPNEEFSMELEFTDSDLVDQFSVSGLSVLKDNNRLAEMPEIPESEIEGTHYPPFSVSKMQDYRCVVKLPKIQCRPWERMIIDERNSGTGNPVVGSEDGREKITYSFVVQAGQSKGYTIVYGKQNKGVGWFVATLLIFYLVIASAISILIAVGIVFYQTDATQGAIIIGSLIGGEVVLRLLSRTGLLPAIVEAA